MTVNSILPWSRFALYEVLLDELFFTHRIGPGRILERTHKSEYEKMSFLFIYPKISNEC